MEWRSNWTDPFQAYLKPFASLVGDRRTWCALLETVKGIIASGSVIGERLRPPLGNSAAAKMGPSGYYGWSKGRVRARSELDADHLTERLRQEGVAQLQESESEEVWLIADGSDLCKPYGQEMPYLMQVPDREQEIGARLSHAHGSRGHTRSGAAFSIKRF